MAESEQDSYWLNDWWYRFEDRKSLVNHTDLIIGEFDTDGTLKILNEYHNPIEKKKDNYYYVETDHVAKCGVEGQLVGIKISSYLN